MKSKFSSNLSANVSDLLLSVSEWKGPQRSNLTKYYGKMVIEVDQNQTKKGCDKPEVKLR